MDIPQTEPPLADVKAEESWDQWFERMKTLEAEKLKPRPPQTLSFAFMVD